MVCSGFDSRCCSLEGWCIYQAMTEDVIVVFASFDDNELVFVVDNVVMQSINNVIM